MVFVNNAVCLGGLTDADVDVILFFCKAKEEAPEGLHSLYGVVQYAT